MVEKGERTWGQVATGLSMSLDGFIAGPADGAERPLGEGGCEGLAARRVCLTQATATAGFAASPVPYASVRLRCMTSRSSSVKAALSCGRPCQAAGVL